MVISNLEKVYGLKLLVFGLTFLVYGLGLINSNYKQTINYKL